MADEIKDNQQQPQQQQPPTHVSNKPAADLEFLNDVSINISIEVGRTRMKLKDLLRLNKDSIIELDKLATEPVDIFANDKLIARGNIITVNGKYCVRLISLPEVKSKGE